MRSYKIYIIANIYAKIKDMKRVTNTSWALSGALLCFVSLGIAYFYFQQYLGLPPCPLCILDRILIGSLGVVLLVMTISGGILLLILRLLGWLILLAGFTVGGRHSWLERFADRDETASCIPQEGTQNMIEWLTSSFIGETDCGVIYWTIGGLSISDLVLILYVVLAVIWLKSIRKVHERNFFI